MRKFLILGLILTVALLTQVAIAGGNAEAGKAVYDKKCASCHGPDGTPKAAIAKMMKVEMRHLGSKEVQAKDDAQLRKDSVEGVGKMRPVKGLSDEDVTNLIAFVRTLKQ